MELSILNEVRLIVFLREMNNFDEIKEQNREAHEKSLNEMEELKRFKGLHSIHFRGEN